MSDSTKRFAIPDQRQDKIYRDNGRRVVICIIRDIAERKRIQKDKYFLAAVVESLEDSVVTVDFDTIITSWNRGAEHIYGYRAEDVIGQPLTMLTLPEDLRELHAKIEQVRRGEAVLVYETERIHKGGRRLSLSRVQQIVWNLVNNAVKFTPRDGRVSVCLSREADKAKLEVEDTGQGIDLEFLPHVFEMFRQGDARTTRTHGGMGIGLALVQQLVDLHDGQIQAHSEGVGHGARFTVWFPLHTTAPERSTTIAKSREGELLGARILVVDDNRDTLDLLRILLEGEGAVVETALSGADALRKAETSQMDLLISDIAMPEMDGYELLKELRGRSLYANVQAIAITGFGREEEQWVIPNNLGYSNDSAPNSPLL
jgi:PAS domain S-box-containing protein